MTNCLLILHPASKFFLYNVFMVSSTVYSPGLAYLGPKKTKQMDHLNTYVKFIHRLSDIASPSDRLANGVSV